jgi:hypothetical protein
VPVNQTAATVTIVASNIITRLNPSMPVVKLRCHSGDMVKEVTCRKPSWPCSKDRRNNAAVNAKTDATNAVRRAGAPAMIKMAAAIGQKMTNKTISEVS